MSKNLLEQLVVFICHTKTNRWLLPQKIRNSDVEEADGAMAEHEDRAEDEDGIRPSQFRERFEGNIPLDEW